MMLWIQGAFPVAEARLHNCLAQEHRRSVLAVPQEVHINPDLGTVWLSVQRQAPNFSFRKSNRRLVVIIPSLWLYPVFTKPL